MVAGAGQRDERLAPFALQVLAWRPGRRRRWSLLTGRDDAVGYADDGDRRIFNSG